MDLAKLYTQIIAVDDYNQMTVASSEHTANKQKQHSPFLPIGWRLELATFLGVLDSLCVRSKNGENKLRKQNKVSWLNFSNADVDIGYYFRPQICKGCVAIDHAVIVQLKRGK